jgi:hypothetical protein
VPFAAFIVVSTIKKTRNRRTPARTQQPHSCLLLCKSILHELPNSARTSSARMWFVLQSKILKLQEMADCVFWEDPNIVLAYADAGLSLERTNNYGKIMPYQVGITVDRVLVHFPAVQ